MESLKKIWNWLNVWARKIFYALVIVVYWSSNHWPLNIFMGMYRENKYRFRLYAALILVSGLGTWWTYNHAINFSSIPLTFLFFLIFVGLFEIFDTYILTGINTIHEINNGNTAVSQFFIAVALVFLAVAVIVG